MQKPMEERGENGRKHVVKKNAGQNALKTHEEDVWENTMKLQEDMITIRGNHPKSTGKWRKPERMQGTNRDDAVKMLTKYSGSAGECDNNQSKWWKKSSENDGDGGAIKKSNRPCFYAKQGLVVLKMRMSLDQRSIYIYM